MTQTTVKKLDELNVQIHLLEEKKKQLKENLKQSIMNVFDEKTLLHCDYETLIGGMLNLQKTVREANDATQKQLDRWKAEGAAYMQHGKNIKNEKKELGVKKQPK